MPKITTAQAAKILGVSIRTVHRRADAGEIPHEMKLPGPRGAYVFDEDAIAAIAKAAS
jgi:excisionase family DNA binding protein